MAGRESLRRAHAGAHTNHQLWFTRYLMAVLVDLTVLNLFDEFWDLVRIGSFAISLLTAVALQIMLKATIAVEHRVSAWFKGRAGLRPKIMRWVAAWALLFVSKLLILWAVDLLFGDAVLFLGPWHGVLAFVVVVMTMLLAEYTLQRIYAALA